MTVTEHARKLAELERLLNDPEVPMDPMKVWSLLAEITSRADPGFDRALEERR